MATDFEDQLRGLMARHGVRNFLQLSKRSGVSHQAIYEAIRPGAGLARFSPETRRKLAAVFPGDELFFVADIIGAPAEAASA